MSPHKMTHAWGHYDESGSWKRDKYCLIYCGKDRCNCGPPNGKYYSAKHDKRRNEGDLPDIEIEDPDPDAF